MEGPTINKKTTTGLQGKSANTVQPLAVPPVYQLKLSPFPDNPPRSRKQAKTSPVATSTVRSTWSKEYGRRRFNAACNPHHDMLFEYRISNLESEISNLESCSVSPHAHAVSHHLSHCDGDSPASIIQSTCPSVMMYAQHRRKVVLSVGLVMMSPIILSVVVR